MSTRKRTIFLTVGMVKTTVLIVFLCVVLLGYLQLHFDLKVSIIDTGITLTLMISFAKIIETIQRFYHSSQLLNVTNIGQTILFGGIASVFIHIISKNVIWWSPEYRLFLENTAVLRFVLVTMTFMLLLSFFWVDQQSQYLKRVNEFALKVERENLQMELNNLQQKLKPHFLFNTLNSISALTVSNPEEAREMIFKLSQFMRNSMKDESEFVTLDEELKNIQLYTEIEKIRFTDRLTIDIKHDNQSGGIMVPHLILQPVIENAIKYGLYDALEPVEINISSSVENNFLMLTVQNPFSPETVLANKGTGYGLDSIRKKLHIIYKQHDLLLTEAENNIFKTTIRIPIQ